MKIQFFPAIVFCSLTASSCGGGTQEQQVPLPQRQLQAQQSSGNTIAARFPVPQGFKRIVLDNESFGYYLRHFPLKPAGAAVHLYNGQLKGNLHVHAAVLDIDAGSKDLQQCADAVMRLRAEYLRKAGRSDDIHFNFTSGFRADYKKWRDGYRINIDGNNASWVMTAAPGDDAQTFRTYLEKVFSFAGTLSLSKELNSIAYRDMQPGDVFIKGGSPGHAVIVMDVAVSNAGQKIYMLAQSYMPAQEIHVLKNPADAALSPWYELNENNTRIETPEWIFYSSELKRF